MNQIFPGVRSFEAKLKDFDSEKRRTSAILNPFRKISLDSGLSTIIGVCGNGSILYTIHICIQTVYILLVVIYEATSHSDIGLSKNQILIKI